MKTIVEEDEIDEDNVNYNLKPSLAKKKSKLT
jgi:hypothetical protein